MKKHFELLKSAVAAILVVAVMFCNPIQAMAQGGKLSEGAQLVLRVSEDFNSANKADTGILNAVVDNDVYSADGTAVLIKAGTPAYIEFTAESNGSWGKAGKICFTNAFTKAVDDKRVALRLSSCKKGGSKLGGVIVLSVLFFPLGLISGCMKGSMPKIPQGTTFSATVMQDMVVE